MNPYGRLARPWLPHGFVLGIHEGAGTANSTPGSGPAREFRTVGPTPRVPRIPAGPGHPRGGIPRPGGVPGGPCWPGALDIENAPHRPL